ncbi:MAG: succinate dehydrogenase assembly factor 2 [Methylotenera sp.]|nr:succinate dehydrogenase assembly factor 2 [Methylotenera sp.]MDP1765943.1 succinate dehydrogenase assembly factor 2 [Methylotenera sp.]
MNNKKSMTDEEIRRLSWRCRRGLLELDIVLQRFSESYLATLSAKELQAFDSLLDLPDNEFLDVVTSRIKFTSVEVLNMKQLDAFAMQNVLTKLSGHAEING